MKICSLKLLSVYRHYFSSTHSLHVLSHSYWILCDPMDCSPSGSSVHGDSPGKNTGVGSHFLLQGIFPTQVFTPELSGSPHPLRPAHNVSSFVNSCIACYAQCPNPRAGREKASKTMQLAEKGKFIADSSQGSRRASSSSGAGSESAEPKLLPIYKVCIAVGSWLKRTGYMFAK